jgi:hypothetical protein
MPVATIPTTSTMKIDEAFTDSLSRSERGCRATESEAMTPLDVAEAHLERFPTDYLFPLAKLSKHPPLLKKMLWENCSNDIAQLRKWDKMFPGCNWGIALRRSRLIVADVDVSKGKPGRSTYELLDMLHEWPPTSRVRSPSGGLHAIYTGQHVMKVNGFGPAIDSPNYIVCAGMPVKDGGRYRYINELPRAEAPSWFYKVLAPRPRDNAVNAREAVVELDQPHNVAEAVYYLQHDAKPAIEGAGGEYRTFLTAMNLRDLGVSEDCALGLMLEHYNVEPKCSPIWDYDGLKQKVANGYAYASLGAIGGDTAEADFAADTSEPFTPPVKNREDNFVTINGYKFAVSRTPRAPKTKTRISDAT